MTDKEEKERVLITGGSGFIGTNLIGTLSAARYEILDLSATAALNPANEKYRRQVDILDPKAVHLAFQEFQPAWVIHLAARAECDENTTVEAGYQANTAGTQNVLGAIKATPSVERVIITSSQFVCGPGYIPKHDEDFSPITVYGQSKVLTEQLTRRAGLRCVWTIIRPTNIWGPWHMRYVREFWRIVRKGLYVHPGGKPVVRCYGYVGNVVAQMRRILERPAEAVDGRVFYLGDAPDDILKWADAFSRALRGQPARVVPRPMLAALGRVGDAVSAIARKSFYITSSRYRSMTSDYAVPMEKTFAALGPPPFSLEEGVRETVEWLRAWEAQR